MTKTFQGELAQLLLATTHSLQNQEQVLKERVLKLVGEEEHSSLMGMQAEFIKLAEEKKKLREEQQTKQTPPAPATSTPQTPLDKSLSDAALAGDLARVTQLLNLGANVNTACNEGWTAVMNATLQVCWRKSGT